MSGLAIKIEIYIDNSAILLVNQNHKISKRMAEFHTEERTTHVVTQ